MNKQMTCLLAIGILAGCGEDSERTVQLKLGVTDGRATYALSAGEGTSAGDAFTLESGTVTSNQRSLQLREDLTIAASAFSALRFSDLVIRQDLAGAPTSSHRYASGPTPIPMNTTGANILMSIADGSGAIVLTDVIGTLAGDTATILFVVRVELEGEDVTTNTVDDNANLSTLVTPSFEDAPYNIVGSFRRADSFQNGGGLALVVTDATNGTPVGGASVTLGTSPSATIDTDASGRAFFSAETAPLRQDVPSFAVDVEGSRYQTAAIIGYRCQQCVEGQAPVGGACGAGYVRRGNAFAGFICVRYENLNATCYNPFYVRCSVTVCDPANGANVSPTGWCVP